MSYDDDWPDNTPEKRKAMVRKTIRPATIGELRQLSAELFPVVNDPWAERFNTLLKEHARGRFYLAEVNDARIAYCRDADQGIWVIPGIGVGIIQAKGLKALAEIVDKM